jgi:hypothetical protein
MILSQSCDIIRDVDQRPHVAVAVLVSATAEEIARAERLDVPSRLFVEALRPASLLVDLDAIGTVHKAVVASWLRTQGCSTDEEQRRLGRGLARHRQRFAFPDVFNALVIPIRRWIEAKRNKASPHGNFVRAIVEMRVRCDNWDHPNELTFLAIIACQPEEEEAAQWHEAAAQLAGKAKRDGWPEPDMLIATYDDVSAREYLESDRLDWDGLSDAA